MIIEVTGTNTWNKGAELMLVAIKEHFKMHPQVRLAVDQRFGTYEDRAQYGLLQKTHIDAFGRAKVGMALLPTPFRKSLGIVLQNEVDVVLDASGFAFGDQHPAQRTIRFAESVEAAKAAGKKVVLLPQALGPFEQTPIREGFKRIVAAADLVFPRDDVSMQYVQDVIGRQKHVRQAPDFTNLVKPVLRCESEASNMVTLVPNQRMLEKAPTRADADAYVPFLARCVQLVKGLGLQPRILIHGEHDAGLLSHIASAIGQDLPVIREEDPVLIKQMLGESRAVIGSRFHALVSGLSQGVPSIATSWSHKYEMLFQDYGCEEMVLSVHAEEDTIRDRLEQAVMLEQAGLRQIIRERGALLRQQTEDMWRSVDALLGLVTHGASHVNSNPNQTQAAQITSKVRTS